MIRLALALLTALALVAVASPATAEPRAFVYSGRMTLPNGAPVEGLVDLEIRFFDHVSAGNQLGAPLQRLGVKLSQGAFVIDVTPSAGDVAAVMSATNLYVELADLTNARLYPRQKLGAVPMAWRVPVDGTTLQWNSDGKLEATPPSIPNATAATSGLLSQADYNAFASKEPSLGTGAATDFLAGDKTWKPLVTTSVPEGTNQYFTIARARSATVVDGAIADGVQDQAPSANTIFDEIVAKKGVAGGYAGLDGGGKIPVAQLPFGGMSFVGTWHAGTNTPTLTSSGCPSIGNYYIVSAGGTTPLDGESSWGLGDWAVCGNGGVWHRVGNSSGGVSTVNGKTGVTINLVTDDVPEGATKKYYPAADQAKVAHLTVTAATDLDQLRADTAANNAKVTYPAAAATKLGHITVTQAVDLDALETDTTANNAKNSYPAGDATKVGFLTVTAGTNLDQIRADTTTNNAKNSYPSGDATKVGHLTVTAGTNLDQIRADTVTNNAKVSYPAGDATKVGHLTVTAATDLDQMRTDTATNNAKVSYPAGDATKVGHLTVTAATDLDQMRTDTTANNAKVSSQWTTNVNDIGYATGKVGIGTTTPAGQLDVFGGVQLFGNIFRGDTFISGSSINGGYSLNATGSLSINYSGYQDGATQWRDTGIYDGKANPIAFFKGTTGRVGIGTILPQSTLDVAGNLTLSGATKFVTNNSSEKVGFDAAGFEVWTANNKRLTVNNVGQFIWSASGAVEPAFQVLTNKAHFAGFVGIDTTDPKTKLDVNGPIKLGPRGTATCAADTAGMVNFDATSDTLLLCDGAIDRKVTGKIFGTVINVPADFTTIQGALDYIVDSGIAATAQVTLQVANGTYTEDINLKGASLPNLFITGNLATPSSVVIRPAGTSPRGVYAPEHVAAGATGLDLASANVASTNFRAAVFLRDSVIGRFAGFKVDCAGTVTSDVAVRVERRSQILDFGEIIIDNCRHSGVQVYASSRIESYGDVTIDDTASGWGLTVGEHSAYNIQSYAPAATPASRASHGTLTINRAQGGINVNTQSFFSTQAYNSVTQRYTPTVTIDSLTIQSAVAVDHESRATIPGLVGTNLVNGLQCLNNSTCFAMDMNLTGTNVATSYGISATVGGKISAARSTIQNFDDGVIARHDSQIFIDKGGHATATPIISSVNRAIVAEWQSGIYAQYAAVTTTNAAGSRGFSAAESSIVSADNATLAGGAEICTAATDGSRLYMQHATSRVWTCGVRGAFAYGRSKMLAVNQGWTLTNADGVGVDIADHGAYHGTNPGAITGAAVGYSSVRSSNIIIDGTTWTSTALVTPSSSTNVGHRSGFYAAANSYIFAGYVIVNGPGRAFGHNGILATSGSTIDLLPRSINNVSHGIAAYDQGNVSTSWNGTNVGAIATSHYGIVAARGSNVMGHGPLGFSTIYQRAIIAEHLSNVTYASAGSSLNNIGIDVSGQGAVYAGTNSAIRIVAAFNTGTGPAVEAQTRSFVHYNGSSIVGFTANELEGSDGICQP